jgi:glyoxylate reductase
MKRVLITNTPPCEHLAPLDGVAELVSGPGDGSLMTRDQVLALGPTLSAIINQAELVVDTELLDAAPGLRIVANAAIGTDNLDTELMSRRGVWATNVPSEFVDSCADCAMGMLLALARKLLAVDAYIRSGRWPADGFQPGLWDGMELRGKTLGVVGYGQIGQAVAHRARAFGMAVIWHDPAITSDPAYRPMKRLLAEADVVSLHVPLIAQTHHLIDENALALMKKSAVLMNFARGSVVDEAALVESLRAGQIGGAVMDVFEHEPLVDAGLLELPNVIMAPHIGGGTHEARRRARLLCAENVAAVLQGREPVTPVNRSCVGVAESKTP